MKLQCSCRLTCNSIPLPLQKKDPAVSGNTYGAQFSKRLKLQDASEEYVILKSVETEDTLVKLPTETTDTDELACKGDFYQNESQPVGEKVSVCVCVFFVGFFVFLFA